METRTDPGDPAKGVRAVAVFEAAKGLLVLAAGCGALSLLHRDLGAIAERTVRALHLNPAWHYPRVFIEAASHLNDRRIVSLAGLAAAYASLRFVEGYGLWRRRPWAEWLAIVSGGVYLPVEVYELARKTTPERIVLLLANAAVVAYLAWVRWRARGNGGKAVS